MSRNETKPIFRHFRLTKIQISLSDQNFHRAHFGQLKIHITKTRLYDFDPLKPHFYIVKLGFIGVYIIFLISAQKHRLWVLVSFEQKYEKSQNFCLKIFIFLVVNFSVCLNRHVFVMKILHADNEASVQTARMRKLIWVFVGYVTCHKELFLPLRLKSRFNCQNHFFSVHVVFWCMICTVY